MCKIKCSNCGTLMEKEDVALIILDGMERYCEECVETCDWCGEPLSPNDDKNYTENGALLCNYCYSSYEEAEYKDC